MASITRRPNGHYWIFTKAIVGKRSTIRLGAVTADQADTVLRSVKELEMTHQFGLDHSPKMRAWLIEISDQLHLKLANAGLVDQRDVRTLGDLMARFLKSMVVKPGTLENILKTQANLFKYFDSDRRIATITPGDVDEFRSWMLTSGRAKDGGPLARATTSRRIRSARQIFEYALRKHWIGQNPFKHVRDRCDVNHSREVYVSSELVEELIRETLESELKLILALSRYAGLRFPSEVLDLPVVSILWDRNLIQVASPKTAHHENGHLRYVPIFDNLRCHLDVAWSQIEDGESFLFPRRRKLTGSSTTNALAQLCRRCGVALWVRPWNNMRASCETDWQQQGYSIFETARWMGHSAAVALNHYNRIGNSLAPNSIVELPERGLARRRLHPGSVDRSNSTSEIAQDM